MTKSAFENTLVVILGPTASGKTDIAVNLAVKLGAEIISADSRQVYSNLSIGTAPPSKTQLEKVRHHLVGHVPVQQDYNVSDYESEVLDILEKLFREKRFAILAGGSGLYIDAVCEGFDSLPAGNEEIRAELRKKLLEEGIEALQNELLQLDPVFFKHVDKKNPSRLIRAIEVCRITGQPFSMQRTSTPRERPFNIRKYGLLTDRKELNQRIDDRVDKMIGSGLVEEAREFFRFSDLKALNTVGYMELFSYFRNEISLEEAITRIKTNTRRYAKRQMTWFKKDENIKWIDMGGSKSPEMVILEYLGVR